MTCPTCKRTVPADAQYCIYCAAEIRAAVAPTVERVPATGPTTRLDPEVARGYGMPSTAPAPQMTMPRQRQRQHSPVGAVWLIGLGLLMLTHTFIPGIFVLIGITSFMKHSGRGRDHKALQSLVFFGGLALIFWVGLSWPLLFLWIGAMILMNQRW